ncbi:PKD domain-containing protein [Salinibacter ruber]|uniref:PKD domain-containing protein n=1 Tax=Salinibacter ruber TaxID=146919 RepID=UPI00311A93BE
MSPSGTVPTGAPVTFDAGASAGDATGYEWTIDGPEPARGTGETLSVSFSVPGDYSATLEVEGRNGAAARTQAGFTVAATVSA